MSERYYLNFDKTLLAIYSSIKAIIYLCLNFIRPNPPHTYTRKSAAIFSFVKEIISSMFPLPQSQTPPHAKKLLQYSP